MTLRPAASLVLVRPAPRAPSGLEVALVRRAPGLRYLGDFWTFPGGGVEEGETAEQAARREAREEASVIIDAPLLEVARWRTPPFGPQRFEEAVFLAAVDDARLTPGASEVVEAAWVDPGGIVDRWANDAALLAPPTRLTLEALATTGDPREPTWRDRARDALARACPPGGEHVGAIDFQPGVRVLPVRTPTLPPATHTNVYVVGTGEEVVVIDAASPYDDERARLDALVAGLAFAGQRVREVLLTHHHHDHSSGAEHLSRRLGVPIAAHRRTKDRLQGRVPVDRFVEDGEVLDLPGPRPRRLRAVLLEGHADGHLAFVEEVTNAVIAGDMVAGVGTIVIDPPEGDMSVYLESLRRLKALGTSLLYPAHGAPIGDPARMIDEYVAHRLAREAKVLAAVEAGAAPVEELVPRAYTDVSPVLYPLAARSLLAHLLKLERDGRVARDGEAWRRS